MSRRLKALATLTLSALMLGLHAQTAWAHDGQPIAPHDLWLAWNWNVTQLLALAGAAYVYWRGMRVMHALPDAKPQLYQRQTKAFAWAIGLLFVALVSPLHTLGLVLVSAHSVQHLLILVAAPLLILSRPRRPLTVGIPALWRYRAGRWAKQVGLRISPWPVFSQPATGWFSFALILWAWHLPSLYEAAREDGLVHFAEHLTLLGTALLFWGTMAQARQRRWAKLNAGGLYVLAMIVPTVILGLLVSSASNPWYPNFAADFRLWRMSELGDQQLAGLFLWIPAVMMYLLAAGLLFKTTARPAAARAVSHTAHYVSAPTTSASDGDSGYEQFTS